jgi:tetratricopeptide (TPR) repeat protein
MDGPIEWRKQFCPIDRGQGTIESFYSSMSTTITSPSPAQIKTFLSRLKVLLDDDEKTKTVTPTVAYWHGVLFRLELLLRGVLVETQDSKDESIQNNAAEGACLVSAIVTHAGKPIVTASAGGGNTSPIPKPLLAGTSVLAGRVVAEKIAIQKIPQEINNQQPQKQSKGKLWMDYESAMRRCQDVNDVRLLELLKLSKRTMSEDQYPPGSTNPQEWMTLWMVVAEGYALFAASLQSDAPPMWKKAWDYCIPQQQQYQSEDSQDQSHTHSWSAIHAVTHLSRIAESKGNHKRVAELTLVLADCYLDALSPTSWATKQHQQPSVQLLLKIFVSSYRPMLSPPTPHEALSKIASLLEYYDEVMQQHLDAGNFNDNGVEIDRVILEFRFQMARAEHGDSIVSEKSSTNDQTMQQPLDWVTKLPLKAKALCDVVVRRLGVGQHGPTGMDEIDSRKPLNWIQACKLLQQYMETYFLNWSTQSQPSIAPLGQRHQDQRQQQHPHSCNWIDAALFVEPVLLRWKTTISEETMHRLEECGPTSSLLWEEEIQLMETVCLIVAATMWMTSNNRRCIDDVDEDLEDNLLSIEHLEFSQKLLHALLKRRQFLQKKMVQEKAELSLVAQKTGFQDETSLQIFRLERANSSLTAFLEITKMDGETDHQRSVAMRQITDVAIGRNSQHVPEEQENWIAGVLGYPFLEFLVCWSGLHRRPWTYCTQTEARSLLSKARSCLVNAQMSHARRRDPLDEVMLLLGEADCEGAYFDGGLTLVSHKNYSKVLEIITMAYETADTRIPSDTLLRNLLIGHCYIGLAKLPVKNHGAKLAINDERFDGYAQRGLYSLEQAMGSITTGTSVYHWIANAFAKNAIRFQLSCARQLVADSLLKVGDVAGAQGFLKKAVHDSPLDADAAFVLGGFRLYMMFFGDKKSPECEKAAQVQLLKAAKLDSSKAGPFALLGYWYEYKEDIKRAIGCYSKAILLDPSQPVAGRGLLRLATQKSISTLLENAVEYSSALNGWAWRALGWQKAYFDGDDDAATICFLKALRCRDICQSDVDSLLGFFFSAPSSARLPSKCEYSGTLAELASCYWRLGRFTAALRTFHSAVDAGGEDVPQTVLTSCARIELELGLSDEAEQNFLKARSKGDDVWMIMAEYGRASAALALAKRDLHDGKAGNAFRHVRDGVSCLVALGDHNFVCVQKVLGDLYSFGACLPPCVYGGGNVDASFVADDELQRLRIEFVSKGVTAYIEAEKLAGSIVDQTELLQASLISDIGSNLIMQAQLTQIMEENGLIHITSSESSVLFESAAHEFRRAIQRSPTLARAWCGLGCAVFQSDPLLAQHALLRSIELDKLSPDPYVNLCFLYTSHKKFDLSAYVSDSLTEVADTPYMWINRALILELSTPSIVLDDLHAYDNIRQSSDAYRASLQVVRHPAAMVGLAMTCRMPKHDKDPECSAQFESISYLAEYLGMNPADTPAKAFYGVSNIERGIQMRGSLQDQFLRTGNNLILTSLDEMGDINLNRYGVSLNVDLLRLATVSDSVNSEGGNDDSEPDMSSSWSLQRLVMNEPSRGDLWLKLAKELTTNGCTEAGRLAASCALSILMQQVRCELAAPVGRFINPDDVSDALTMQYWLKKANRIDHGDSECEANSPSSANLQRALLISPGNPLARAALQSFT